MAWPDDALLGGAEGAAAVAPPAEAEAGTVRLQFASGQRLGACVAWDRCSGLLAVELQPAEDTLAGNGIQVAILDPQAPQSHFVAVVAAASPSEHLAALAWSPPGCRRLLLTVTSAGRAFAWSMEPPLASAEAAAGAAAAGGDGGHVPCVNRWYGQLAFELPLQRARSFSDEPSLGLYPEPGSHRAAGSQQPWRLLCCRFLEPPGHAAAAWDVAGAPPFADRAMTAAEVVDFYRQRGLERAFASRPPQPPADAGPPQQLPLHWLRPGLLCFAAVTSGGQLLLACSGRGLSGGGGAAGASWVLAPPVQLFGSGAQLALADVAAAGGTASLLVAVAMATAEGGPGQAQLLEVAGPPPPLLGAQGTAVQQPAKPQHQRVARVVLPPSAVPPSAGTTSLAFLPGRAGSAGGARLLLTLAAAGGTRAAVLTCSSSGGFAGGSVGLHSWQVQAGSGASVHPEQLPAAAAAACQDGAGAAVLLPGAACLLSLDCWAGDDSGGATCVTLQGRPAVQLPGAFRGPGSEGGGVVAAWQAGQQPGLALSPHGLFAAVAAPGSSALLLVPLLAVPSRAAGLEAYMLELGKRCCWSLLTATAAGAWWDLAACAAAAAKQQGYQHLQLTQQLVDAAVAAARPESRRRLVIQWARLKSCLLSAAAVAHPPAAADCLAASVQADAAAKEWVAAAADVFDLHMPDPAALKAAAMSQGSAALSAESRAALAKMLPARYWAMWAVNFSHFLVRCLHAWVEARQREQSGPAWPAAPAPTHHQHGTAHQFAAEQSSLADCVPCIRLLSDLQFYHSFGRLISSIHQLTRMLKNLQHSSKPNTSTLMLQQLQVLSETSLLLRHLHDSYAQARQAAESAGEREGGWPRHAGAWTLVHATPGPALGAAAVAAALHALRQQPGGSVLLQGAQAAAEAAPGGQAAGHGDAPRALLAAAVPLGLLPEARAAGGGAGMLHELLLQRDAALAAAAAGDAPGCVPLPAPDWSSPDASPLGSGSIAVATIRSNSPGVPVPWPTEATAVQRQWEVDRGAALGLPVSDSSDPLSYQGSRDALTGRPLSWEYPILYASADGSYATSELLPEAFAPGCPGAWQAAYAAAPPIGGQPWKRLRAA